MKGSILGRRFEYVHSASNVVNEEWTEFIEQRRAMISWCENQQFERWCLQGNTFLFYHERDYMLFMLRWT